MIEMLLSILCRSAQYRIVTLHLSISLLDQLIYIPPDSSSLSLPNQQWDLIEVFLFFPFPLFLSSFPIPRLPPVPPPYFLHFLLSYPIFNLAALSSPLSSPYLPSSFSSLLLFLPIYPPPSPPLLPPPISPLPSLSLLLCLPIYLLPPSLLCLPIYLFLSSFSSLLSLSILSSLPSPPSSASLCTLSSLSPPYLPSPLSPHPIYPLL